ncbi:MAG TPA: 5-carboxymethyl-2-hydroxymuconate semialdehyde dehydrogenase [Deinococcales bacterium]|nr:5-carboxymethyl-2-hydroxymuconate semialdehyde dehydrogenase [Deinococcales bacterium]
MCPATNEPLATVAAGHTEDVDRAARAARHAFQPGSPWRRMKAPDRARLLHKVADLIDSHVEELAVLETLDCGQTLRQTLHGQIPRAADNFRFFADLATRAGDGHTYPTDGFLNYTLRQPVGVAGLITPWNTPFMLETWKLAPALAAGCTAVLKPAEWSPVTAWRLAHIFQEAGVPPGVLNVVHGFGEEAGKPLTEHPEVNVIALVGETSTGSLVMQQGAATLKRFHLELGGKSPVVVFDDADLDRALDAAVFGVMSLNGQRCTASSRLIVQDTIYDDFVARVAERVRSIRVGDPLDPATEVGPLIHPEHIARVLDYVRVGQGEGAQLMAGGGRSTGLDGGNFFDPTFFARVDNRMRVAQEEVFGPFLVAIPFRHDAEALALANDVRYGLASYLWTSNLARAHNFAHGLEAGMVWVNSQNVRHLPTPFGGVKGSGMGRDGGEYSFEFYMEHKNVAIALGDHPIPPMGKGK